MLTDREKETQRKSRKKRNKARRNEILTVLGNTCAKCGFSDERALAIDHIFGGGTRERKIGGGYYSLVLKKIKSGSKDYQILCFNCNQIKKVENNE